MNLNGYIVVICEGSAEQAIMELLLNSDKLIFGHDRLFTGEIIKVRKAKKFEERYLKKGFQEKITILRILDSRKEQFKLSPLYADKIEVINIITAPEIEMLVIINEDGYEQFKKSKKKASDFCKSELKLPNVKSYNFVLDYFSDTDKLIHSIKEYRRVSKIRNKEYMLYDLLKDNPS